MTTDSIVVLHSVTHKLAAKTFTLVINKKTGEKTVKNKSYGSEMYFRVELAPVGGFAELCEVLAGRVHDREAFIIRGKPLPDINFNYTRRLRHRCPRTGDPQTFAPAARHWLPIDMDRLPAAALTDPVSDPEGAIEYLIGLLPPDLHDASCFWQFSASQSVPLPGYQDTLSARLWFWSREPLTDAELTRWAAVANRDGRIVDPSLFQTVQPIYLAAPGFVGMGDPLPRRNGIRHGLEDEVSVVIPPPDPKNPEIVSGQGYEPGLGVGAYLDQLGPNASNRQFIRSAICSYIALHGGQADVQPLYATIRAKLDQKVPGWRTDPRGERYVDDDHLDAITAWVRRIHGNQPPKQPEPPPDFDKNQPPPTGPGDDPPPTRPIVQVAGGEMPRVIDRAEGILCACDRSVYAFGDQIVRPALRPIFIADEKETIGLRLVPIAPAHMAERFTRVIDFRRFDKKAKKWVSIDCPRSVAVAYLERIGMWRLPRLTALTTCPLLLPDGRILERPGFDAASGVLFDPQGVEFPPVPEYPTKKGAREALKLLMNPFRDFPFVDEASRSVLRSLLLSSVSRLAILHVPCHAFDAPAPGTGKSKLFDCAAILLTGRECAVISQAEDEVEFEKKLGAILLAADPMISVDNCTRDVDSPFMGMVLTQSFVKIRILGLSKDAEIPTGAILGATGNGFSFAGDMLRRGLTGHLDAGVEKPWEREFDSEDPVVVLKRNRQLYVTAALTVLRGYIAAGRPRQAAPPLGSFEGWSRLVRDALLWLDQADPAATIESARKADPAQQNLSAVITQWHNVFGNRSLTTRAIIEEACVVNPVQDSSNHVTYFYPELRNALLDVAGDRGRISPDRLGTWLRDNKQKIVGDRRIASDAPRNGYGRWRLECRQEDGSWQ